jgi:hypothetical protein
MAKVKVTFGEAFPGILFLVFLMLKLSGVVGWSWWLVTCPIWFGPVVRIACAMLALIAGVLIVTSPFHKRGGRDA